jgi:cytochrome c553
MNDAAARKLGVGDQNMKLNSMRVVFATAILATVLSAQCRAEDSVKADLSGNAFQAKVTYCKTCHGVSGQGFHGSIPIPRLAGQQPQYIDNQLKAFIERRRENKYMYNVAHVLKPEMQTALSKYFSGLTAKPVGGAPKELISAGKKIFEDGFPDKNVPPCASCHGPEAKGEGEFPRLAGQLHDYIFNKLTNWSKERGQDPKHPDTSAIMEPIAHNLTEIQIKEVAAYLNYLE